MPTEATPLFLVYAGVDLDRPAYRAVASCPPAVDDFRSYDALGMPYPLRQHFRATGVSMFTDRRALEAHTRKYGLPPSVATLDLASPYVVWTASVRSSHLTVWAPASLLLELVVQCEDHG